MRVVNSIASKPERTADRWQNCLRAVRAWSLICSVTLTGCMESPRDKILGPWIGTADKSAATTDPASPPQQLSSATAADKPADSRATDVAAKTIRFDGQEQVLGQTDVPLVTPDALVSHIDELLKSGQAYSAARLVEHYPEVTSAILLTTVSQANKSEAQPPVRNLAFIAQSHDRCSPNGAHAWEQLTTAATTQPQRFATFLATRQQFETLAAQGQFDQALALPLVSAAEETGHPLLVAVAGKVRGQAALLADKPRDAALAFHSAALAVEATDARMIPDLLLLTSEALRRAGDEPAAAEHWKAAVTVMAQQLVDSPGSFDPSLLDRAIYLRLMNIDWPAPVVDQLSSYLQRNGAPTEAQASISQPADFYVWTIVGHRRLARHEPQAALVAFKKAETCTRTEATAAHCRLLQSRALIDLAEVGPANAMLIQLTTEKNASVAREAKALLGAIRVQSGQASQGVALLTQVLEDGSQWQEKADAEGDLGLALLIQGQDQAGLEHLHSAQQQFQAAGRQDALLMSLTNELRYQQYKQNAAEVQQVTQRISSLEQASTTQVAGR